MIPKLFRAAACGGFALAVLACGAAASSDNDKFSVYKSPRAKASAESAAALEKAIRWSEIELLAVQDAGRYKTLDSFARETLTNMTGAGNLPELGPLPSLFEWLFNRDAYADEPLIKIRDKGLRIHFSAHMSDRPKVRERIVATGLMSWREFNEPQVQQRIEELEPRFEMNTAINRVRAAEATASFLNRMIKLVPQPGGSIEDPWFTPMELLGNMPEDFFAQAGTSRAQLEREYGPLRPVPSINPDLSVAIVGKWAALRDGWLARDAATVQAKLGELQTLLPTLAGPGVYPGDAQRKAERLYYQMHKFTYGWIVYLMGAIVGVAALVTRWKTPFVVSLVLLILGLTWHAFGLGLRWYILGRIPVANMFEAVVASAWIGIVLALIVELFYRTRLFLVAAHLTGFLALILAGYVIPGAGNITTIMGILDDVMLRIHTVLIIASYALIFLAAVIALIYLFGYYFHTAPARSAEAGLMAAAIGAALWLAVPRLFAWGPDVANSLTWIKGPWVGPVFWSLTGGLTVFLGLVRFLRLPTSAYTLLALVLLSTLTIAVGNHDFVIGMAYVMLGTGAAWAAANGVGLLMQQRQPALAPAAAAPGLGTFYFEQAAQETFNRQRWILAGAAPGDEKSRHIPEWLKIADWSHLIILNLVFVMLFVGVVLGAVWADYSWGRPWGWDPKEVFALNTWIIYAILIHMRFIVAERGLWTAWLSVAGCLMMAFNWCFVNFFIVGLHSYA